MDNKDQGSYAALSSVACAEPGMAPLAAARGELIVVNKLAGLVQFFDARSQALLAQIEMAKFPHEVVLSADRSTAYVSIYGQGVFSKNSEAPGREVAIIDLASRAQVGVIDVSPYRAPHGMGFDAQGILWVSCDLSGVIIALDVEKREVIGAVETGSFGTHWLTVLRAKNKLYATNKHYDFVAVVDTAERKLAKKIPFPQGSEGLGLTPDGSKLFVMAQRPQQCHVIDTNLDEVVDVIDLKVFATTPEGRNPQKRVQVSPDGSHLLITSFDSGEIAIAPLADLRSQTKLTVEKGPMGITFANERLAYVMNHDQGTISIVDVPRRCIVNTFATARGPETLAVY
ncbi:MAG: YncE family protein [Burkholderiales bacterium]